MTMPMIVKVGQNDHPRRQRGVATRVLVPQGCHGREDQHAEAEVPAATRWRLVPKMA